MSGDPGYSTFLINLQKLGTLCKEHGQDALFTDYLLSIPTGNTNTVEQIKTDQNPSCQHPRTLEPEISQKKHDVSRKDNRNNNETVSGDAEKGRINAKDEVCKKDKVKENQSPLIKCIFCKKERVRINHHYLKVHKLDLNVWAKNLKRNNRGNATICPQCNRDYRNSTAFREHLSNFHNIHLEDKNRRRSKTKDAQEHEDMPAKENNGDRVEAGGSMRKITPFHGEGNESSDEEETEMQIETVSQGDKVENTNAHKINHVEVNNVKERCKQCGEFIEVASFDSHTASHAKEREMFPFKTNRAKILSYFSNDTLKKTGQEGGNLVSNRGFISDNETNNVNQDDMIGNKTNLAGNLVETDVANENEEHRRLSHVSGSQDSDDDETIQSIEKLEAEAASIDKKVKRYRKSLWREFFERMRNEDIVVQAELFNQYVLLYKDM